MEMTAIAPVAVAAAGGFGVHLLYTAAVLGRRRLRSTVARRVRQRRPHRSADDWLRQAGISGASPAEVVAVVSTVSMACAAVAAAVFGGIPAAAAAGIAGGLLPLSAFRSRRARRMDEARDAWPRLLEELRLLTGSLGRSIPQALFDVGRRAPEELRDAFAAAERHWLLSTDLGASLAVLKDRLADGTADVVCETLLVAHELGGSGLDGRLRALIDDRHRDLAGRKDALAKQAGVRFARRFVLVVPLGMAAAGLAIGTGREAYATAGGQAAVVVGIAAVAGCWLWAGRLLRLPGTERVLR